jgi:ABC-type nitrate/sulfonate/bicarbonate transport system substrate-binding protein
VYLALQGLTLKDVQLVDLPPNKIIEKMRSGEIDAAMTWQPHVDVIAKELGDKVINLLPRGSDAYLLTITTPELLTTKKEAFKRYLKALLQAEAWVQADPERARLWIAQRFKLDPVYVGRLWPDMKLAVRLSQEILEIMDGEARWLAQKKEGNPTPPNFANTLYTPPLAAINPAAVTVF